MWFILLLSSNSESIIFFVGRGNIRENCVYILFYFIFFRSSIVSCLSVKLKWAFVFYARTRILRCGFMGLDLDQCLQFLPARITACKDRINNRVDFGKGSSSLHSILDPLDTLISTTLRLVFLWNLCSKILGKPPWVVRKANHLSSPNKYGKTATSSNHFPVFQGLDVSLKVAN